MPFLFLVILFVGLPLTEFALLIRLAESVGLIPTLALVLLTGVLGASLARQQGLQTLMRIRGEMASGKMPGDALFDGALILVAGAVLITPGVLTDAFGFCLLIPPLRAVVKRLLRRWAADSVKVATFTTPPGGGPAPQPQRGGDQIIDAQVIETRVERD